VVEQVATLKEINECWNIEDIMQANAVLDFKAAICAPDERLK
jgi:hypothetical protein